MLNMVSSTLIARSIVACLGQLKALIYLKKLNHSLAFLTKNNSCRKQIIRPFISAKKYFLSSSYVCTIKPLLYSYQGRLVITESNKPTEHVFDLALSAWTVKLVLKDRLWVTGSVLSATCLQKT